MHPVLQTLADLVSIDSVNPEWGGPGERAVADYVRDFFERAGIEVGEQEVLPGRPNVVARLPGANPGRRVVLEAHMDTVSVADMTIPPFEPRIEGGLMYGRGSCDTKAGLAAMMHAVRAVGESGERPPCEVWLAAVVDEEHAFRGVSHLVGQLKQGPLPEAAVVAEPTGLRVARANKGVLRWRIVTRGKAAHSSRPELGVNAITAMAEVIRALEAYSRQLAGKPHPLLGPATHNIGLIEGGAQVNFVPERCTITLDRRLLPGEAAEAVLTEYEALLDRLRGQHPGLQVGMEPPFITDEAMETPGDTGVVRTASSVLSEMNLPAEPIAVPFGCDCTKLSRAGIPSVIFGPGSIDRAHAAIESVETEEVELAFDFHRRFLLNFGTP